ncbi:two-component system response regulator [Parasediminibacterium paludis]|uniref:Two-component system response regulator n=1 Tax=Parasediminibacterium paludis TaxID=908966 RepID=A0ABV8PTS1_9BACT
MQVLIVDNSIAIIERIEELLLDTVSNLSVVSATCYLEAVAILQQALPDIILLDGYLPNNLSLQLVKEIKQYTDTNIIILQNCNDDCMRSRYLSMGVDYILDKYLDFTTIPAIIRHISIIKLQVVPTL